MRVVCVRAENPGPFTLEGTNTYVVSDADGAWVVDPGPALGAHLSAVAAAVGASGAPWRGVLLTHDHADHAEGDAGAAGARRRRPGARRSRRRRGADRGP